MSPTSWAEMALAWAASEELGEMPYPTEAKSFAPTSFKFPERRLDFGEIRIPEDREHVLARDPFGPVDVGTEYRNTLRGEIGSRPEADAGVEDYGGDVVLFNEALGPGECSGWRGCVVHHDVLDLVALLCRQSYSSFDTQR